MVNFPNQPSPIQPNQPQRPVNGAQPTGPVQPTEPSAPTQNTQSTPSTPNTESQNQVQNRPAAATDPVQTNRQGQIAELTRAMNEPADRTAIHDKLNDDVPNDVAQLKGVIRDNVRQAFGDDVARNLLRKLGGDNAQTYNQLLQGFIDEYKSAPPEKQKQALDRLIKLMSEGAVNILNDDPGC